MKNKIYNPEKCFCRRKQKNIKDFGGKKLITKNLLVFILASLICLAGIVYVFQINKTATMGYEIKEKETKIKELQEKSKQLEIQAAQLRSIYISQIQEQQRRDSKDDLEEERSLIKNKDKEGEVETEEERCSVLNSMRKPVQVSFIEVEIEKIIAMK